MEVTLSVRAMAGVIGADGAPRHGERQSQWGPQNLPTGGSDGRSASSVGLLGFKGVSHFSCWSHLELLKAAQFRSPAHMQQGRELTGHASRATAKWIKANCS